MGDDVENIDKGRNFLPPVTSLKDHSQVSPSLKQAPIWETCGSQCLKNVKVSICT